MFMKGSRLNRIWRTPLIADGLYACCTVDQLAVDDEPSVVKALSSQSGMLVRMSCCCAKNDFVNSSDLETDSVVAHTRLLPIRPNREALSRTERNDGSTWKDLSKMRQIHPIMSWHKASLNEGE